THAKYAALIETIKQKGAAAGQELLATVDKNDPDRERKIVGGVIDATRLEFEALNNMYHPGCGGASELLRGILVDLGINAQVITEAHESHRYLFLPDSGLGLVHGDDLYNKAIFELEGQELLKTQAEIEKHWEGDAKIRESAANDLVLDLAESNVDPQMVERRDAMASSKLVSGDEAINYFDEKSGQWAQWSVSIGEVLSNAAFPPGYLNYIAGADDQRATVLEPEKVQEVYRSACVDYGYTQAEAWNGTGKTITDRAEAVRRVAVIMGQGLYGEIIDTKVLSEEKYEQMTGELGAETYGDKYSRDYPKTPDDKQYWAKRRKKKNAELKQQGKLSDIATSE
ncbi:MAG: hypothetical protein KC609_19710, partial [Myxococcales bacterium]|nr:hypothetical protein [Myxococcales bacterium]